VTGRIAVYAEARSLAGEPPCAKTQGLFLCLVDVGHGDIEVHLLWVAGIGPLWWLQVGCELEGQPRAVGRVTDDHPVAVILHPLHAEQFLIEGRQPTRVRAVNDESVPPSDHRPSLHRLPTARLRRGAGYARRLVMRALLPGLVAESLPGQRLSLRHRAESCL